MSLKVLARGVFTRKLNNVGEVRIDKRSKHCASSVSSSGDIMDSLFDMLLWDHNGNVLEHNISVPTDTTISSV